MYHIKRSWLGGLSIPPARLSGVRELVITRQGMWLPSATDAAAGSGLSESSGGTGLFLSGSVGGGRSGGSRSGGIRGREQQIDFYTGGSSGAPMAAPVRVARALFDSLALALHTVEPPPGRFGNCTGGPKGDRVHGGGKLGAEGLEAARAREKIPFGYYWQARAPYFATSNLRYGLPSPSL